RPHRRAARARRSSRPRTPIRKTRARTEAARPRGRAGCRAAPPRSPPTVAAAGTPPTRPRPPPPPRPPPAATPARPRSPIAPRHPAAQVEAHGLFLAPHDLDVFGLVAHLHRVHTGRDGAQAQRRLADRGAVNQRLDLGGRRFDPELALAQLAL